MFLDTIKLNFQSKVSKKLGFYPFTEHDLLSRKREIRLLKNREAARECRRKKKEYIKCLENRYSAVQCSTVHSTVQYLMCVESRVAVLENQNKALIEELKSLKELYTGV